MKIEQSKVKIIISKEEYDVLMEARDIIGKMREELYNEDLDDLNFYPELLSLDDSLTTLESDFEKTKYGEYIMEVD